MKKFINSPRLLLILFSLFFTIIPFFWLSTGEVDLGGDSTRLYFYDPINYLLSYPLYSIAPDGTGNEMLGYFLIPFVLFIFLIKIIFQSPHLVITVFNSISLVVAFLSVYLIVKELLKNEKNSLGKYSSLGGIIAGCFYVFSPILTNNGWDKAMYVHNQFFLNPLMFYLLLLSITQKKHLYAFLFLFFSFIFSPNFTLTPYFFSFYPLAIIFLFLYSNFVKKYKINFKKIFVFLTLFLLLHAYHLFPTIANIFTFGSSTNLSVFSEQGKYVRGLSYFSSVVEQSHISTNLVGLGVNVFNKILQTGWLVFPFVILLSFAYQVFNKNIRSKTYLLLFIFFLILIFAITANITSSGLVLYKNLFHIPGFSMFRNYYGQFGHVYVFFYALLVGYSFYYLFTYSKKGIYSFVFWISLILVITTAVPFIRGDMIRFVLNKDTKNSVSVPIVLDPAYEKILQDIRNDEQDTKYIELPLADVGYQMIAGVNGGAYQGPSTISYLTGKNGFVGSESLGQFNEPILKAFSNNDTELLIKLFSLLSINHIFYNSDPYIYDTNFPKFPYQMAREYMPSTQDGYKKLISKLPVTKEKASTNKYQLYKVNSSSEILHIYTPNEIIYTNNFSNLIDIISAATSIHPAIFLDNEIRLGGEKILYGETRIPYNILYNNSHLHVHAPYVSRNLSNPSYFFVIFQEKNELRNRINNRIDFFDQSLFLAAKRIIEVKTWAPPISYKEWNEPNIIQSLTPGYYNSWEASLSRYAKQMKEIINTVSVSSDDIWKEEARIKIKEQLDQNYLVLLRAINNYSTDKEYLQKQVNDTFTKLYEENNIVNFDNNEYILSSKKSLRGEYDVYYGENFVEKIKLPDKTNYIYNLPEQYSSINKTESQNFYSLNVESNSIPLPEWNPKKQYVISFEFITNGKNITLSLRDERVKKEKAEEFVYFEKNINSSDWQKQELLVTADEFGRLGLLTFLNENLEPFDLQIRNLVQSSVNPIELVVKSGEKIKYENPVIISKKINPTKYIINVKNAQNPYIIVFSEAFNNKWKLNFDSVSVSDKNHLLVNGYANAWIIYPDDTKHKNNYTLTLEFQTQKIFYFLFLLSSLIFMSIVVSIIRLFYLRKW